MRNIKKPLAAALCCTVIIGGVGTSVYAMTSANEAQNVLQKTEQKSSQLITQEEADLVKDETVYVLAKADGSVEKIIVSDWIKNAIGSSTFSDKSELTEIENVKGDESYTMNGSNTRVWDAQGNDIYYQGNIQKELPVTMSVSYKLDGKSISASELSGKSGKVTIRFDYKNNQYETVEIDGKQEKIYVPFAMLTGMLLDNDVFTNVEVSNGKLINDGNHTVVAGIAFPGLQDDLNVDKEKLEIPDYVEITADVKEFEMTNTVTVATGELFGKLNTEKLDSADELTDSLDELSSAMSQLMDGSSQLYDGLCTLLDKSGELISGIDKLAAGADKVKSGAASLDSGLSQLAAGAASLESGLNQLAANNDTINGGAKQVFNSLLSTADSQLAAAGASVPKLTIDNYAQVLTGVISSLNQANAAQQAAAVSALKEQLDSYNSFYMGLSQYTAGVASAKAGAAELNTGAGKLSAGASQLYSGTDELYNGIITLKNGAPALTEGITALRDGAMQLSDGLNEFNEKGIKKLVDAVEGDFSGLFTRIKATADVAKNYKSFAGISEDMDGQVKFIYRTEAVK